MYQALYRKWRPRVFEDVVGQEHITSILRSEIEHGKLSHAYLFCGPRGTGKTTCAKIIAKAANCLSPVDGSPCGECEACRAIDAATTTDVVEMDAASNNGVDSIRELREGVVYTPADLKYRIYIIDEVHMLSISAFNALLKTLEEPPSHVIFILATTELHKIPATVLSRCQRFDFHRVDTDAIIGRLETVCAGEGIAATRDALSLIARLSQGGMRDSLNMLEYCAGDGDEITVEKAERLLGASSGALMAKLAESIADRDTATALSIIEEIFLSSRDIAVFWREWIAFCRDMMIALGTRMAGVRDVNLQAACTRFTLAGILYLLDIFMSAESDMQRSPTNARLYAEMALIRACDASLSTDNEALLARIAALEDKIAMGVFTTVATTPTAPARALDTTRDDDVPPPISEEDAPPIPGDEDLPPIASEQAPAPTAPQTEAPKTEKKTAKPAGGKTLKSFKKWQEAVRRLAPTDGLFAPFLQGAYAYDGSDGIFYLFFDSKFGVTLLTDARKQTIAAAVHALGGKLYDIHSIVGTVREDGGEIREPIDDLLEMEEAEVCDSL
ncbi:MAG: DNA polymerase III subunit gamma/tau [Clostridia bacterium]|nr:DNA polymerase III subunit gamma/tau [Clostridia bacterium]